MDAYLADKALPIWASLSAQRTELYRDIRSVFCGSSPFLQRRAPLFMPLLVGFAVKSAVHGCCGVVLLRLTTHTRQDEGSMPSTGLLYV